jgi:hypothetical protein
VKRLLAVLLIAVPQAVAAQTFSQRGFVEGKGWFYPRDAPNDPVNGVGDLLAREDLFVKPASWIQFAAGADVRANSHRQVDRTWRVDFFDRGRLRPALTVRRLSATFSRGPLTVDAGKQFIRWGKTDIVTPTDWFAPRDFLNVIDNEFLPVTGVRGVVRFRSNSAEGVWVPRLTPSRVPLPDDRWTVPPPGGLTIVENPAVFPDGEQGGVRFSHIGSRVEFSLAYFDGFNHLPNFRIVPPLTPQAVTIVPDYPTLRSYGGDAAIPLPWFTAKIEAAYFTTDTPRTDEYVLYVLQLERQIGEWSLMGGYAGEHVTKQVAELSFAPNRGLTRAIVGRASYTIDINRSLTFETAVRQNGDGTYFKGEFSQAAFRHWRTTVNAALIRGEPDDFIGQYRLNSYAGLALRYSF